MSKEKKYTLEEVMKMISDIRKEMGASDIHARDIKDAEKRGYERAKQEMKHKVDKMFFV